MLQKRETSEGNGRLSGSVEEGINNQMAKAQRWYQVKQLFLETKQEKYKAFRIDVLLRESSPKRVLRKARGLGKRTAHPHGKLAQTKWEYLGPSHIFECLTPPVPGGMLGCYKDEGNTWSDALRLIQPESEFELNMFKWGREPSPEDLYCVDLVYFVRPNKNAKRGRVTTCTCIVRSRDRLGILEQAYRVAVDQKTRRLVIKVRRDVDASSVVEFAGISDIIPIYREISNGMELNRTVQSYPTRQAVLHLLPNEEALIWES